MQQVLILAAVTANTHISKTEIQEFIDSTQCTHVQYPRSCDHIDFILIM